jgi:tRNA pseudouridine38-40 synthase
VHRYALLIEYDGTPYCGWQRQALGYPSIQAALEEAFPPFVEHNVRLYCAGRTDSGVHATHQVAHVDLEKPWKTDTIRDALNFYLKAQPISVLAVAEVSQDFNARKSALRREYVYRIENRRAPTALEQTRAWHIPKPLDADAMVEAAQHLVGHHDFTTFRSADCQALSPIKTLEVFQVWREKSQIFCRVSARSFLHHQVRFMVGSLAKVGDGRWQPLDLRHALEARSQAACGVMAPAYGLTFTQVEYTVPLFQDFLL